MLKNEDEFDFSKSNLILSNNSNNNFKNISLNKSRIQSNKLRELLTSDNQTNIKYYNEEEKEDGTFENVPILYNHEDKSW